VGRLGNVGGNPVRNLKPRNYEDQKLRKFAFSICTGICPSTVQVRAGYPRPNDRATKRRPYTVKTRVWLLSLWEVADPADSSSSFTAAPFDSLRTGRTRPE
jgi:hypothetical protein